MKVSEGTVVTLAYEITDEAGEILESSAISGPITFLHGNSRLIPGLDRRLVGMIAGQEAVFEFPPEDAFGRIDDAPTRSIPRGEFPAGELRPGLEFEANTGEGDQKVRLRVVAVTDTAVNVQMIHPLAGQKIGMSVQVLAIRDASPAEKAAGHVLVKPPPPPASA